MRYWKGLDFAAVLTGLLSGLGLLLIGQLFWAMGRSAGSGPATGRGVWPVWAVAATVGLGCAWLAWRRRRTVDGLTDLVDRLAGDQTPRRAWGTSGLERLRDRIIELGERLDEQRNRLAVLKSEWDAVLHSMDGGVLVLDRDQRICMVNRAAERMLGLTASSATGRLVQESVRQADLNRFIEQSLSRGRFRTAELHLRGGPAQSVRATSSRLTDAGGEDAGLIIVLNDVTRLRRLEEVRSDFAANVSHELRTPITNIRGYLETLLDTELADRERAREFLEVIARNADRLGAIVEDMLLLTKLEEHGGAALLLGTGDGGPGSEGLLLDTVLVGDVVARAVAVLDGEAREQRIEVIDEVPHDLWAAVNPSLLQQAIGNLLSNAVRYSPPGKRVWIRGERRSEGTEHATVISVADEGPGISEQHLSRLFERFYRVDRARSREQGGTGLGLAIVKHIAQLHGGSVELTSEEGLGSTFQLVLPENAATQLAEGGQDRADAVCTRT